MSSTPNLSAFKADHCKTLIPETGSNHFYVKLPVKNYTELSLIKSNLLSAIQLISEYNEILDSSNKSKVTHSISTLVNILQHLDMEEECEGLSELIE